MTWIEQSNNTLQKYGHLNLFLQRVSIACYAKRCISYRKSVRLSVCLSVCPSVCHTLALCQNDSSYDHAKEFDVHVTEIMTYDWSMIIIAYFLRQKFSFQTNMVRKTGAENRRQKWSRFSRRFLKHVSWVLTTMVQRFISLMLHFTILRNHIQ